MLNCGWITSLHWGRSWMSDLWSLVLNLWNVPQKLRFPPPKKLNPSPNNHNPQKHHLPHVPMSKQLLSNGSSSKARSSASKNCSSRFQWAANSSSDEVLRTLESHRPDGNWYDHAWENDHQKEMQTAERSERLRFHGTWTLDHGYMAGLCIHLLWQRDPDSTQTSLGQTGHPKQWLVSCEKPWGYGSNLSRHVTPKPWGHSYQVSKVDPYPTPQDIWLYIWSNHLISGSWICLLVDSVFPSTYLWKHHRISNMQRNIYKMWNNVETNQHTDWNPRNTAMGYNCNSHLSRLSCLACSTPRRFKLNGLEKTPSATANSLAAKKTRQKPRASWSDFPIRGLRSINRTTYSSYSIESSISITIISIIL